MDGSIKHWTITQETAVHLPYSTGSEPCFFFHHDHDNEGPLTLTKSFEPKPQCFPNLLMSFLFLNLSKP